MFWQLKQPNSVTQPSSPPAAIECGWDSCKQMLPPTGQSGDVRRQRSPFSAFFSVSYSLVSDFFLLPRSPYNSKDQNRYLFDLLIFVLEYKAEPYILQEKIILYNESSDSLKHIYNK